MRKRRGKEPQGMFDCSPFQEILRAILAAPIILLFRQTECPVSAATKIDVKARQFTSRNMPKIDRRYVNGVYESGAITFPVIHNNQQGQVTAVAIRSENEDTFWTITAAGTGEAAELADKTAREFTFK
jgi:hypothetical protein